MFQKGEEKISYEFSYRTNRCVKKQNYDHGATVYIKAA
jgi:hypothetical protein